VELDGWLLRASSGVTRRANSALAPSVDGPLDERIDAVERFYRERGLVPLVQVMPSTDERLDEALARRGYARVAETIALTAPASALAGDEAEIHATPVPEWLALLDRADGYGPRLRHVEQILAAIEVPAAYALVRADGEAIAQARGAADGELLGIYQVATLPRHRRRGHARACMATLARWGSERRASTVYVLVEDDNRPARRLYAGLGFEERFRYWYRARE
jgi:ribosomal protein S18 acetylase RimI-like enzyme